MIPFREFLNNICNRPAMFVGVNNFELVVCFIDGYAYALKMAEYPDRPDLQAFGRWLAPRHGLAENLVWYALVRLAVKEESARLSKLLEWYDEFIADQR